MNYRAIALAVALWCSTAQATEVPPPATQETLVALTVNGKAVSQTIAVLQSVSGDDVWLKDSEWKDFGVMVPKSSSGLVGAKSLGITVTFESSTQTIHLQVPASLLPLQDFGVKSTRVTSVDKQPKGVMLNYDLAGSYQTDGTYGVSIGHDARMGVGSATLVTTGQLNVTKEEITYKRGLTTLNKDFLKKGVVMQVGDVFTPRSNLSGNVNLGGVRVASDRGLAQGDSFYPVPMLGGIAETRSTAELYLDGQRGNRQVVQPGPYQLQQQGALSGANDVSLVLRDEFGREQVVNQKFYVSPNNLKKGKTEFDVSAGLIREDGDRYGEPALSAKIEHGVSDKWTLGGSVQATKDSHNAGVGSRVVLGNAGVLSLDYSQSDSPKGKGDAWAVGYDYKNRNWSVRANHSEFSEDYWRLSDEKGDVLTTSGHKVKSITSVGAGITPRGAPWSVSLAANDIQYHDGESQQRVDAMGRYRKDPNNDFSLGVSYDITNKTPMVSASWRHRFGNHLSASASARAAPDISAAVQLNGRNDVLGHEVSWSAGAIASENKDPAIYANAKTSFSNGDLEANVVHNENGTRVDTRFLGSVWVGEGGVLAQRQNYDGFVLVEVPGQKGVPVGAGNGMTEKTNKMGYAIVSGVGSLHPTPISINPNELPIDVAIESSRLTVTPGRRSGAKATFDITTNHMREVRLSFNGKPIEPSASFKSDTEEGAIGIGGVATLLKPVAGQVLMVSFGANQFCKATLPSTIPGFEDIIQLQCEEVQ